MKDTGQQIHSVCWLLNLAEESAELEDKAIQFQLQCCTFTNPFQHVKSLQFHYENIILCVK